MSTLQPGPSNVPWVRPGKRRRLSSSTTVTITLQDDESVEHKYYVQRHSLGSSGYFRNRLLFDDSVDQHFRLEGVNVHYFEVYLDWMVIGKLDMPHIEWAADDLDPLGGPICQLYHVGNHFSDNKFKNFVMDSIGLRPEDPRNLLSLHHSRDLSSLISAAFELFEDNDIMCNFFVDVASYFWRPEQVRGQVSEYGLPAAFLVALCMRLGEQLHNGAPDMFTAMEQDPCLYHSHAPGEPKCAKIERS